MRTAPIIVLRNHGKLRYRFCTVAPTGTTFAIYLPATAPLDLMQSPLHHAAQQASAIGAA